MVPWFLLNSVRAVGPSVRSHADFPCVAVFLGPCSQCQEARAVKHRWLANGQQPLAGGVQVPMQPAAAAGMYGQAPQ